MGQFEDIQAQQAAIAEAIAGLAAQSEAQTTALGEINSDLDTLIAGIPPTGGLTELQAAELLAGLTSAASSLASALATETAQTQALADAAAKFTPPAP